MSHRITGRLAFAFLALAFAAPSGLAQKKSSGQDPSEKPRNVKPEIGRACTRLVGQGRRLTSSPIRCVAPRS